jgi:hypothetical protein
LGSGGWRYWKEYFGWRTTGNRRRKWVHKILLTGIRADTPIGAMAAFGLIRLMPCWRFCWENRLAGLHTPESITAEHIIEVIARTASDRPEKRLEFSWADNLKSAKSKDWEEAASKASTPEECGWLVALGAPGRKQFYPTPFDMTSGSQKFLRELAALPHAVTPESVREALFGPWQYEDSTHSLGWDPVMMRAGAFTSVQPRDLKKQRGVTAAIWLASESLPLFPCFLDERGKLAVRGWIDDQFQWPIWDRPIALAGLKALIRNPRHPEVQELLGASRAKAGRQPGFGPAQAVFAD